MGNSNVTQHIETAQKTGVCQLCKVGLKEVGCRSLLFIFRMLTQKLSKIYDRIWGYIYISPSGLKICHSFKCKTISLRISWFGYFNRKSYVNQFSWIGWIKFPCLIIFNYSLNKKNQYASHLLWVDFVIISLIRWDFVRHKNTPYSCYLLIILHHTSTCQNIMPLIVSTFTFKCILVM